MQTCSSDEMTMKKGLKKAGVLIFIHLSLDYLEKI